ncbi:hypothetical protein D1B31_12020 [Neobacillus notoginsengisoli]|uniref:Uncharacterized protein n=1 Tax=Neobacillus notoginsengisoli TaxID=1578198 RepID=A0A417YT81_9BACI|nr:hypothetical protein [Neobacillus notoginsengisoli]RHW40275.1 hypothetical protein D1B31_12020 [Neobacillus notoginsengisoli]
MKELTVFKRWLYTFGLALILLLLALVVDVGWIKKTIWILLAIIGAVAAGYSYQMYEYGFDIIEKRKKK